MEHVAKVFKVTHASNGTVVFHARCCDEPSTEARHTSYVEGKTEEQIDTEVQAHLTRTANLHAAVHLAAQVGAKYLKG